MRILLVSAVALLDADGRVLMAKWRQGTILAGRWEVPARKRGAEWGAATGAAGRMKEKRAQQGQ